MGRQGHDMDDKAMGQLSTSGRGRVWEAQLGMVGRLAIFFHGSHEVKGKDFSELWTMEKGLRKVSSL